MLRLDLRYALRQMVQNKGFAAGAILALGLGIGAATTMFAAADSVIFGAYRGIPEVERLVQVWDRYPATDPGREVSLSVPNYEDYREGASAFDVFAGFQGTPLYHEREGGQEPLRGLHAAAGLFELLDAKAQVGRLFTREEDQVGAPNVAVLSHGYWQQRFGGDPEVVGSVIRMARFKQGQGGWTAEPYEVIGVLPPDFEIPPLKVGFEFASLTTADVILPFGLWTWGRGNRGMWAIRVLARLDEGATVDQAREQLGTIASGIAQAHPETNAGYSAVVAPVRSLARDANGPRMVLLLSAAGLLLLIACANVAGLLMARALSRRREIGVRAALGAARGRILRQLLTESAVLALCGGVAGVLMAYGLTGVMGRFVPADIYGLDAIGVDLRVLAFALAVALGASILFGILPGLRSANIRGDRVLRAAVHGQSSGDLRGFRWLVAVQIALAFVLLSGAGVLGLSLATLLSTDVGFEENGVVLLRTALPPGPLSKHQGREAQQVLYEQVMDRLGSLPGVVEVSAISHAPLEGVEPSWDVTIADRPAPPPDERQYADGLNAGPGYFRVMGIPVVEGRAFSPADVAQARQEMEPGGPLPERPVIINDGMAEQYWPGESAIGKTFYWGMQDPATALTGSYETGDWDTRYPPPFPLRVVGVVGTVNMLGLPAEDRDQFYMVGPQLQGRWLAVRVEGDGAAAAPALRDAVAGVDPEISVSRVETMAQRVRDAAATQRFQLFIISGFGVLATLLALVGLFGVMAFAVNRRARELGIRLALGASPDALRSLVVRQAAILAAGGIGAGLLLFVAGARLLDGLVYGVAPVDLRILSAGAVLLAVAAVVAALAPAARAARLDPVSILTAE